MNHRRCLVALSVNTLVFALLLAGCGGYESDAGTAAGGSGGQTGTGGAATGGEGTGGEGTGGEGTGGEGTGGQTGTGGGTATCTNVTPCGGDVVGTWNVTSSCLTVTGEMDVAGFGLGAECDAAVTGSIEVSGTWTANADGTYSDNTTTSGNHQIELSAACKEVSGTTTTCERLGLSAIPSLGYASASCQDAASGGGCTCPATVYQTGGIGVAPMYPSASGSYTISGNVLTITAGEQEYSYCVSGTTLTMTPQSTTRTGTVTGTVELQRQ
jgi:hypothetical protein